MKGLLGLVLILIGCEKADRTVYETKCCENTGHKQPVCGRVGKEIVRKEIVKTVLGEPDPKEPSNAEFYRKARADAAIPEYAYYCNEDAPFYHPTRTWSTGHITMQGGDPDRSHGITIMGGSGGVGPPTAGTSGGTYTVTGGSLENLRPAGAYPVSPPAIGGPAKP